MKSSELWQRLRQAICISLLLGLAWVFGILASINSAEIVFAWLFVIFNAFQGVGIFIVFCVLQDDVRNTLAPYFRWIKVPDIPEIFSRSTSTYDNQSTGRYTSHSYLPDIEQFNEIHSGSGNPAQGSNESPSTLPAINEELGDTADAIPTNDETLETVM